MTATPSTPETTATTTADSGDDGDSGGDDSASGDDDAAAARQRLRFVYRGSITTSVTATDRASFEQLGQLLAGRFRLRESLGSTRRCTMARCWVLEVNPRYPASAELFEADDHLSYPLPAMKSTETAGADFNDGGTVRSFIRLHADVWQGQTVNLALQAAGIDPTRLPLSRPGLVRGKWIVYARSPMVWPERIDVGTLLSAAEEHPFRRSELASADVPSELPPSQPDNPSAPCSPFKGNPTWAKRPNSARAIGNGSAGRLEEHAAGGGQFG
jgi:hypothetical protein